MGFESNFSSEKFVKTARELESKIKRDEQIHALIAKLPGQLDKMAAYQSKVIHRFIDLITGKHYQILQYKLKRMERQAGKRELSEEYLNLLKNISEAANEEYDSGEKLEAAIGALRDFESTVKISEK